MQYIYPFIISFIFIFFAELGDKTQILVLSFSTKNKATNILLGVALGTLFSHGLAIVFGSHLGVIENDNFIYYLKKYLKLVQIAIFLGLEIKEFVIHLSDKCFFLCIFDSIFVIQLSYKMRFVIQK